jgi:hypothetical protein
MTWQSETRAWAVAAAAAFCLGTIGYKAATAPKLPDLAPTVKRTNATLDILNAPCKGDSDSCGTVASVGKLVKKIGDIAVTTQLQVKQSSTIINAASQSLTSTSGHLNAAIDTAKEQLTHVGPLLDSAKTATDLIPPAVKHISSNADEILANSNGAVTDFRGFLTNPHLKHTFENVDSMTSSGAGVMWDFRTLGDKYTDEQLKPVKWYMYPEKRAGEILDIGAFAARHAP